MWSQDTLTYAAGFLDGEGCFSSSPTGKITVTMSNTYLPVVKWFQKEFGGNISKADKRQPHHRSCYTWIITGPAAERLCRHICIHLKEKSRQAAILIAIRQTFNYSIQGKCVDSYIKEERERLSKILKEMKHVEY